ncbi:MAG: hypothetical protein JW791_03250 [Nanoarchaeota archaeon]|nr:hypothetical protein [Nanoarchaeota archaeon]
MNFSYQPKYASIAEEVKDFIISNGLYNLDTNFIIGGDGSLFTYKSFNQPNMLICSEKFSKGHYASCWYEDDYQFFLLDYAKKPESFHIEIPTIELLINGEVVDERAINDLILGRDYNFKAGVNEEIVHTTGLLFYTFNGWSGWAKQYDALRFEDSGVVDLDTRISHSLEEPVEVNVLPFHGFNIMFDGKGRNLEEDFNPCTSDREIVYTSPWSAEPGDNVIIRDGEPVILVQQDLKLE